MDVKFANRAKMTTETTGTGNITLGVASSGFQTFASAGFTDGQFLRYVIEDGLNWEIGTSPYGASGKTLVRTITESSNAGAAISLSGSAIVFASVSAEDIEDFSVLLAETIAAKDAASTSAAAAAVSAAERFATFTAISASTALTNGKTYFVMVGFNGEAEAFKFVADSTLTADGALVLASAMASGRLISTRTEVTTVPLLLADVRSHAVGLRLQAVDFFYIVAASDATDHHLTTAGGVKLYVQPDGVGYNLLAFNVVGDWDDAAATGTDDTVAFQAALDALGNLADLQDNPIIARKNDAEVYLPATHRVRITATVYCQWFNINLKLFGTVVADDFSGNAIDFDYNFERRPGLTPSRGAAAYKRHHVIRVRRKTRQWTTVNAAPIRYDRIVFTFSGQPTANDTFRLNNRVYTFVASSASDVQITIGGDLAATITNAVAILAADDENLCVVASTSTSLTIEYGASYLSSYSTSSAITDTKFRALDQGVVFGNIWDSIVEFLEVVNFTISYDFIASGTSSGGFGMETAQIVQGRIEDNQVSGRVRTNEDGDGGYIHDFTYEGGNWRVNTPAGGTASHYGFVFDNVRASNHTFNNVDHEPSTPADLATTESPTFLLMGNAFYNRATNSRAERATILARIEHGMNDPTAGTVNGDFGPNSNVFQSGFQNLGLIDRSKIQNNYVNQTANGRPPSYHSPASIFNVPLLTNTNLYTHAIRLANATEQTAGWMFAAQSEAGPATIKRASDASHDDANGSFVIGASNIMCVGLFELEGDEEFLLTAYSPSGDLPRPCVKAFNSSDAQVTGFYSVLSELGDAGTDGAMRYASGDNSWRTFADRSGKKMEQRIKFNDPNISYAYVGFLVGSSTKKLATAQLFMRQNSVQPRVAVNYAEPHDEPGVYYVNAATIAGPTRRQGQFYYSETDTVTSGRLLHGYQRGSSAFREVWVETASS